MSLRPQGRVSLVGAGPGHPDHLTQKAVRRLQEADLVLFDALVSDDVRKIARRAEQVYVGKRAGQEQTPQAAIERLLIEAAHQGRRVVRLKGGDPFVFGRGGEEALALQAAGVAYEIVPGITAAVAAPALAGIPVTHRGVSAGFLVITGSDETAYRRIVDALPPGAVTIVALMAMASRDALAARLIAREWPGVTPAAIVIGAGTDRMWSWRGQLDELGAAVIPPDRIDLPGTIVVGNVVALPIEFSDFQATSAGQLTATAT